MTEQVSSVITEHVTNIMTKEMPNPKPLLGDPLTDREREVLILAARGFTAKDTGKELGGLSDKTIKAHRTKGYKKLGIFGIANLTRYAIEHGWVDMAQISQATTNTIAINQWLAELRHIEQVLRIDGVIPTNAGTATLQAHAATLQAHTNKLLDITKNLKMLYEDAIQQQNK